jgi:hypothetical protein
VSDVACTKENAARKRKRTAETQSQASYSCRLLAEKGLTAAIIMLVVILVYQQLENHVLKTEAVP